MKYSRFYFSPQELVEFVIVFTIILCSAKFGQYLYYGWQTSPALLWAPTGIGMALIWLKGYKMVIPIFGALVAATATGPLGFLIPTVITTPAAQVMGNVLSVYLLRRWHFDGKFTTVKSVSLFLLVNTVACLLAPTVTTMIAYVSHILTAPVYIVWSRQWAGYLLSCLIIFPFMVTWFQATGQDTPARRLVERVVLTGLVWASVYCLFWRPELASVYSFLFFAFFFVAFFWVCLRFSTKILTLALIFLTVFGILGLFLEPAPDKALNEQLFFAELFLFLVVPIFYLFSALVKERAATITELHELMKKYERENVAKTNFVSVLAHELRNPLAPVKTTLEILKLQETVPETLKLITSAEQQVHSMRRLLDDLLDISRVTQGKFELKIKQSNLLTLIKHSIQSVTGLFQDRDHTIILEPSGTDKIWLAVDPVRFEQIVVNVLNNAAKYTPPHGTIRISTAVRNDVVEVTVSDNGLGIKKENLEDIFAPFWQSEITTHDTLEGIGVGLSLTRHIVEMHGGTIAAYSEGLGKGSTFIISMPFDITLQPEEETMVASQLRKLPAFRILVVDDNHAATDSLTKLLLLKGHSAECAYSAREMLEKAQTFLPQVVLLDIGLPDMSGFEAAQALRMQGYTQTLIALSGYGQKEDKEKALASGCDYHITKPMRIEFFEEYLRSL